MATAVSCGIIILGIYIYTVSMTTEDEMHASDRCTELISRCLNKFQQFDNNPLCGELKEAINCLSTSDMAVCEFSAFNHTMDAVTNQTHHHVTSNFETDQSHPELYRKIDQSKRDNNGNDAIVNTKTQPHDPDSGTNSELDGIYGNSGSQSDQARWSEGSSADYLMTLVEVIEEAKEEYKSRCNVNNIGTRTSPIARTATAFLIGVIATVHTLSFYPFYIFNAI